jgi:iron complex transport system ATP-binding protein
MTLAAHNLTLRVPGRTLVRELSFELAPGACCALLGRNGAGKTNVLLALAGLRACDAGHVSLAGQALHELSREETARRIGVLLQEEHESFWGTVEQYIALGCMPRDGRWFESASTASGPVRDAIETMELVKHAQQPYRTLSGGERQRARIAQLLVQDPGIFLLDEPLTHLDLGHQVLAMERFAALARAGRIVLMILHEPLWASRYCGQALLLYDSARFCYGAAPDVLTRERLEALYGCRLESIALHDRTLLLPSV